MSEALAILPVLAASGIITITETICGIDGRKVQEQQQDQEKQNGKCGPIVANGIQGALCLCCLASIVLLFINQQTSMKVSGVFILSVLVLAIIGYMNPVKLF